MDTSGKVERLAFFPTAPLTKANKKGNPLAYLYPKVIKRIFDLTLAVIFLPLVLPILGILALLIKLDSKGPVIYRSKRIGKNGEWFDCFKLRTMCLNADEKLIEVLGKNHALKIEWEKNQKLENDPRITKIGKMLRVLSLDELPQIFNVIKGEMSFVGPRPIVNSEISRYANTFEDYKKVKPGITGLWQTSGRNSISYNTRIGLDKTYSNNVNLLLDLKIIFKTVPVILFRKGAY